MHSPTVTAGGKGDGTKWDGMGFVYSKVLWAQAEEKSLLYKI